jgi:hypothetical protein
MFTEGNEIKESRKRIKTLELIKLKKSCTCDRQTVLTFFKDLTHVPLFNEEFALNTS